MTPNNRLSATRDEYGTFSRLQEQLDALVDLPTEDPPYGPNGEPGAKANWVGERWIAFAVTGISFAASDATRQVLAEEIDPALSLADCINGLYFLYTFLLTVTDTPEFDECKQGMLGSRTDLRARLAKRPCFHPFVYALGDGMFMQEFQEVSELWPEEHSR